MSSLHPPYIVEEVAWFVISNDGIARRVGGAGLLIGRAQSCDVVLAGAEVSRRHLLLQFGLRGTLDIVPMQGATTTLNGVGLERVRQAVDGDLLRFPGGEALKLVFDTTATRDHQEDRVWLIEIDGRRIRMRSDVLELGGDDEDIVIDGWPRDAARLAWCEGTPSLEAVAAGCTHNGTLVDRGVVVPLAPLDRIAFGTRVVTVVTDAREPEPTLRGLGRLRSLHLEMLPSGGTLRLETSGGSHLVVLSERRFALAMVLLAPPEPHRAGEFIPDETVVSAVWPRSGSADRGDLNQLVFRLRADLKNAGLAGAELVERSIKGGATRFVIDAATKVLVAT